MITLTHPQYNVPIYKRVHAYTFDPTAKGITFSVGECTQEGEFLPNQIFETYVIREANFDYLMQGGSLHPSKPAGTFKPEDIDKMFELGMYDRWN